jgi:hypothetical protein
MDRYSYNNRYEPELWLDSNPSFAQDEAKYFTGHSRHSSYNQQPNNTHSGRPPRSSSHSIGPIPFGHDYHRSDTHNRRQSTITPARHASIPTPARLRAIIYPPPTYYSVPAPRTRLPPRRSSSRYFRFIIQLFPTHYIPSSPRHFAPVLQLHRPLPHRIY